MSQPAGVRKTVTVVFCDVTGSTALGERLDPEALRGVIQRYFAELKTILERHGGTVEKFIGDAVMAVFGVPILHEDDALRAVRAAADMGRAIKRLNTEASGDRGVAVAVRTGVNTGEVVAGDPASGHGFVSGDAVNVAARLEQAASPGEVLIGDQTYTLVQDAVRCEPVAPLELKGKSEPVPAFRMVEVFPWAPGHARRLDSPMVGREGELARLQETYASARDGPACMTLTVVGEAGVGKSRLVEEFLGDMREDALVLRARCLPYGEGITFWPVAEAVRAAASVTEDDSPEAARDKIGAMIVGVDDAPLIQDRVAGAMGLTEVPADIRQTFWAIRKFLEALARDRPLILVLDDLQWAEPTFLDLVQYIGSFTWDRSLFVLGIARPDLLEARADWGEVGAIVHLTPLSDRESDRLIASLLGSADLPEDLQRRIVAAAKGTPLFVEEMLRKLLDEGFLSRADGRWVLRGDTSGVSVPLTIQALLGARLDRLAEEERALLQRASVVGEVFWWGAVAELTPIGHRDEVGSSLHALLRKELILPDTSSFAGEDAFRFSHLLVRDVAYDSVPKALRADYHVALAGWLESAAGDRVSEYEEILGYHLERASRFRADLGLDDEITRTLAARAAERLTAGGRRALAAGDLPAAANLLSRATAILPPESSERLELLPELGFALTEIGELTDAAAVLAEAMERGAVTGNRKVELHARLERGFLNIPMGKDAEDVRVEVEGVIPQLEEIGDDRLLSKAWRLLGLACWIGGRSWESALEKSIAYAEHPAMRRDRAEALELLAAATVAGPLPVPEGLRRCEEIPALADGDRKVEATALTSRAVLLAMIGRFEEAREVMTRGIDIGRDLGLRLWEAVSRAQVYGTLETLAGDPVAAEREQRKGVEALERMGEKAFYSTAIGMLAHNLCALGRYAEAEGCAHKSKEAAARDDWVSQALWRRALAKVLARRGSLDEAEAFAREAVSIVEPTDFIGDRADALMDLADILRLAGRAGEAIPFMKQAIALFEQKGNIVSAEKARRVLVGLGSDANLRASPENGLRSGR